MADLIERQASEERIDEALSRVFVESSGIGKSILKDVPSTQPEIIRCKDCRFWQDQQDGVVEVPICARPENEYEKNPYRFIVGKNGYCSFAESKTVHHEHNLCSNCKWVVYYGEVDKNGTVKSLWFCKNWRNDTEEKGYCHKWDKRAKDEGRVS